MASGSATFAITTYNAQWSSAAQDHQNYLWGTSSVLLLTTALVSPSQTICVENNNYSTSGMGTDSNSLKGKAAYDPQHKWGLSPAEGTATGTPPAEATYIVAGNAGKRDIFLSGKLGQGRRGR